MGTPVKLVSTTNTAEKMSAVVPCEFPRSWPGPCFNIKHIFLGIEISMIKIRRSWDRLFFIMGIPILGSQHLYTSSLASLTQWPLGGFNVILKLTLGNGGWGISYKIALRWMPLDLTDDKSTFVQVMAWCRHYLSQCWPTSMSPNDITRPQWVQHG